MLNHITVIFDSLAISTDVCDLLHRQEQLRYGCKYSAKTQQAAIMPFIVSFHALSVEGKLAGELIGLQHR